MKTVSRLALVAPIAVLVCGPAIASAPFYQLTNSITNETFNVTYVTGTATDLEQQGYFTTQWMPWLSDVNTPEAQNIARDWSLAWHGATPSASRDGNVNPGFPNLAGEVAGSSTAASFTPFFAFFDDPENTRYWVGTTRFDGDDQMRRPQKAEEFSYAIVPEINGSGFAYIAFILGALGLWLYSGAGRGRQEETPAVA